METLVEQSEVEQSDRVKRRAEGEATRKGIRGSSLLLVGRLLSIGINFAAQVLMVRYLSTTAYGALGYALSMVDFCQAYANIGFKRAITRFVPIYHEKGEYDKLFGTILLVVGTTVLIGLAIIVAVHAPASPVSHFLIHDQRAKLLLLIMIFLVPIGALNELLIGLCASFASPRAIFFCSHLLLPGLKFSVALLLILERRDVTLFAYGYLFCGALGVLIYSAVLLRLMQRQGVLQYFQLKTLQAPARAIFAFTIPVLVSDLVAMHSAVDVFLLGHFHNTSEVAAFRVVLSAARLNTMVLSIFVLLYTPSAARLFAKSDYAGINTLYWRMAVWMAVFSFPIFALTFSMAQPLTVFLYGVRYQRSGMILALLSLGYYSNVLSGFNGETLRVLGKVRYVVTISLIAAITNVAANLLLIPRYGALGAAISTAGTIILQNILLQVGLRQAPGIHLFERKYLSLYLIIVFSALGLFFVQFFSPSRIYVALALASLGALFVFAIGKKNLKIADTFPELQRLPLMRLIFT